MNKQRFERGQTLVLIILAIVGMFGFSALAVDMGRVFSERRRAQNAADSAAYAAALAASESQDYVTAALNQTSLNDFTDPDPDENAGQVVDVQVYNPPISGPYADSSRPDYLEYFQVMITAKVNPIFAQFVYNGGLGYTVEAVAHSIPIHSLFAGDAMVATNQTACKGVWFQGAGLTDIYGGNIFSNSSADGHPSSCHSGVQNGSGGIQVNNGSIETVGTFSYNPSDVYADYGINRTEKKDVPTIPLPDCSGLPHQTYHALSGGDPGPNILQPGIYSGGIKVNGGENVQLVSGLYCLEDDMTMLGGSIRDVLNSATGTTGVLIYMKDGSFNIGGNVVTHLNRMNDLKGAVGNPNYQWGGMLLYMPTSNDGEVHIGGGGASTYTGTIYAPGEPHSGYRCTIEGNGTSVGLNSNVICDTIYVTGSAKLEIHYKEEANFRLAPMIELAQ